MEFNFFTALWKALRSALLASLVIFLTTGGFDAFLDQFASGLNPLLPVWTVPIVAAVITVVRNFAKQWLKSAKEI